MGLETVVVDTGPEPESVVVWLHGLGADAHDFEPIIPMLRLAAPVRFVFPNAPVRPVSINNGAEMRAWYDFDPGAATGDASDIRVSTEAIGELLDQFLDEGFLPRRLALAGFSQGGVIALETGLGYPHRLAGILGLSTYVHDHERLGERIGLANIDTPILLAHGLMDPMIPITRAITGREALRALNYSVAWREYSMGHQVCPEEVADISNWLNETVAAG